MVNGSTASLPALPDLADIRAARLRLGERIRTTPVWASHAPSLLAALPDGAEALLKLELFQFAGSFKPRGALNVMLGLDDAQRGRGVTAVSAGNHAMAVAYAAQAVGTTAKVAMPETANPGRIAACRAMGAEVVLVPTVHEAFAEAERIAEAEGRHFVHPFDGPDIVLGTATLGLELVEQCEGRIDSVVVPIGGGGLCAGTAAAVKQLLPDCRVIGVEPTGADSMSRSFAAGAPQSIDAVRTIADSLGAPYALPYTYGVCAQCVDEIVQVEDEELRQAMGVLFREAKLAVEPAGAATAAALMGPLAGKLGGRVALIVCGANTDLQSFATQCAPEAGA